MRAGARPVEGLSTEPFWISQPAAATPPTREVTTPETVDTIETNDTIESVETVDVCDHYEAFITRLVDLIQKLERPGITIYSRFLYPERPS